LWRSGGLGTLGAMMRARRGAVVVALAIWAAGCADLRQDFGGMQQLVYKFMGQFHRPVNVNIANTGVLTLTVAGTGFEKMSADDQKELAFSMASFALREFHGARRVLKVVVQFVEVQDYGPAHVQHTLAAFEWQREQLDPAAASNRVQ
jgi:hypothetical protein